MRERYNDVPGDIVDEDAGDLPLGYGTDNPDMNPDAMVEEVIGLEVRGLDGDAFIATNQPIGDVGGAGMADGRNIDATVDPADLLEGNEGHPGAAVGFTGEEREKR